MSAAVLCGKYEPQVVLFSSILGLPSSFVTLGILMACPMATTTNPTKTLLGHTSSVWTNCFTHGASHIATCSSDETVRVWDLTQERGKQEACLNLHAGVVRGCDYSPRDSTLLATCSWDKTINIHSTSDYMVGILCGRWTVVRILWCGCVVECRDTNL